MKIKKLLLAIDSGWGQEIILLLPQAAVLPESDSGAMVLSRHWVSSSKPSDHVLHTQYSMQAVGHAVKTWFAVCSVCLFSGAELAIL